jgi:osmotically-inducible protein OsmY
MLRLLLSLLLLVAFTLPAVAQKKDPPPSDDAITDRVRQRLVSHPDVKGHAVEVETKDGVVRLGGSVETARAKSTAEKLVKRMQGVRGVVNELRVDPPRPPST